MSMQSAIWASLDLGLAVIKAIFTSFCFALEVISIMVCVSPEPDAVSKTSRLPILGTLLSPILKADKPNCDKRIPNALVAIPTLPAPQTTILLALKMTLIKSMACFSST